MPFAAAVEINIQLYISDTDAFLYRVRKQNLQTLKFRAKSVDFVGTVTAKLEWTKNEGAEVIYVLRLRARIFELNNLWNCGTCYKDLYNNQ